MQKCLGANLMDKTQKFCYNLSVRFRVGHMYRGKVNNNERYAKGIVQSAKDY